MLLLKSVILSLTISVFVFANPGITYDTYFTDQALRIDYYHIGDAVNETVILDQIYKQGIWGGTRTNLTQPIDLGHYFYNVYDKKGEILLFSWGFDTYFHEYQTTKPARDGQQRSYHESAIIPCPVDTVIFVIERRDKEHLKKTLFTIVIDPGDYHINTETSATNAEILAPVMNSNPGKKVDIVILGDGYTSEQRAKFANDLNRYKDILFAIEPFSSQKSNFNIYGIFAASPDSGVDEPTKKIYRKTTFSTTFNSLDSPRYLLTEDNKTIRDYAALVPYDIILIMINSDRYGGGGIYNSFCTFTSDGPWNEHILLHEFGHTFAGLADEYFSSDEAYEEFFPRGIEPKEPNITALLNPDSVKWKIYLSPDIAIPTPWDKEKYEKLTTDYAEIRHKYEAKKKELVEKNANAEKIKQAEALFRQKQREAWDKISNFFASHPLKGKIGAFLGAGYDSEAFYRPTINSIMHRFSEDEKTYYPVNEAAIKRVIKYYTE